MSFFSQNDFHVVHHRLSLQNLPPGFEGLTLVHLSDLHFYEHTDLAYYENVLAELNRQNPDIVVLTGDIIHYSKQYIPLAGTFLKKINAKLGKFAALGNHDYFDEAGTENICTMLAQSDFSVLKNESLPITLSGNDTLWIGGLDDLKYGKPDLQKTLAPVTHDDAAVLLLAHNPLLFDPIAYCSDKPVSCVLSGHTHGGHFYMPWFDKVYRTVFRMKYRYGFYERQNTQLYVTSGVGSPGFYYFGDKVRAALPRFRHNIQPEIAVFRLKGSSSKV
ncbi:MAG: metallophosphoesterase [Cyanobacteria bacterium]|nr:metallophosphoesterase [Cyanobacteriota bacterium]